MEVAFKEASNHVHRFYGRIGRYDGGATPKLLTRVIPHFFFTQISLTTPDESVRSSATSGLYPPLRDPLEAAQEWRNQEEMDYHDRGTSRRRRPGVTFDEPEDKSDLETPIPVTAIHQRPQSSKRFSRLR